MLHIEHIINALDGGTVLVSAKIDMTRTAAGGGMRTFLHHCGFCRVEGFGGRT